jgi:hypothetical protein
LNELREIVVKKDQQIQEYREELQKTEKELQLEKKEK